MNNNPVALVTGGGRGLGRATALALAGQGTDLIVTWQSREADAVEVVAAVQAMGRRAAALRLDVGDVASFPAFAAALGSLLREHWERDHFDYLVNNAGIGLHLPFAQTSEQQFDQLLNVHFKGVFFLTQALLPLMKDGGRIVNLSSGLARFTLPGHSAYAAMKGAIEVLSRYLARELGPRGIAVNVVAPGAIATDFGGGMVRDDASVNAFVAGQTALGRAGLPEDVGGAVAALLGEGSRWINAQRIEVSGGMFI